jgi:hypothetical protein
VKTFVAFLVIGSLFATAEEFLTIVVLRRDIPSYLFTLLILFPTYLGFVSASSRIIDRLIPREPARDLAHLLIYGSLGLLLEWSLMGLSPWSNPVANPLLMFAFQVGMFAFWATVAIAPRVFLDHRGPGRHGRQQIVRFFVPYFVLVYGVGLSVPERLRFPIIIPLIVVGYSVVAALLFKCIVDLSRDPQATWHVDATRKRT